MSATFWKHLVARVLLVTSLAVLQVTSVNAQDAQYRFETQYRGKAQLILLGVPADQIHQALDSRNGRRMIPEYMSTYVDYKNHSFFNIVFIEEPNRGWGFQWGKDFATISEYFSKKRDEDMCATNFGTYLDDDHVRYAIVMKTQEKCTSQSLHKTRPAKDMTGRLDQDFEEGARLKSISMFFDTNRIYASALTQKPKIATSHRLWHPLNKFSEMNAEIGEPKQDWTRRLRDLTIAHDGENWRFAGTWQDVTGAEQAWSWWDAKLEDTSNRELRDHIVENNFKITSVAGYVTGADVHNFRIMATH